MYVRNMSIKYGTRKQVYVITTVIKITTLSLLLRQNFKIKVCVALRVGGAEDCQCQTTGRFGESWFESGLKFFRARPGHA